MSKGYKVIGKVDQFQIINNNKSIISTSKIKTKHIFVVILESKNDLNNITYDLIHQLIGHPGRNKTFKYAENFGEKISTNTSSILPCEDCALSKIRRQDIIKSTSSSASKPGQRIYVYTSWVNFNRYVVNKYWFLLVDKLSGMIWSMFVKNKSDLKD